MSSSRDDVLMIVSLHLSEYHYIVCISLKFNEVQPDVAPPPPARRLHFSSFHV